MVEASGVEPPTYGLQTRRSPIELCPLFRFLVSGFWFTGRGLEKEALSANQEPETENHEWWA